MSGTSYMEFLKQYEKEFNRKNEEEEVCEIEEGHTSQLDEELNNKNEADMMITKLCRICGSRGMIDIYATVCEKYLTIPKSRLSQNEDVTIAEMIERISSEKVEKTDSLPQFICPHCLSYLQHAYNVRLEIIHTRNNLREARKIATDESIALETSTQSIPLTLNQKEIIIINDEIEHDKYINENFERKNVKIKITSPTKARIDQRKAVELKCPGCFRKSYGAKSHNEHMSNCLENVLKIFFGEFQMLYKGRFEKKITQEEYSICTISLIFNYMKKIEVIAKKQHIDIESISKITPDILELLGPSNQQAFKSNPQTNNRTTGRFSSPDDFGYFSNTQ